MQMKVNIKKRTKYLWIVTLIIASFSCGISISFVLRVSDPLHPPFNSKMSMLLRPLYQG